MNVTIREIENGLVATVDGKEYGMKLLIPILDNALIEQFNACGDIPDQIRAAILKAMGEGEERPTEYDLAPLEAKLELCLGSEQISKVIAVICDHIRFTFKDWLPPDEVEGWRKQAEELKAHNLEQLGDIATLSVEVSRERKKLAAANERAEELEEKLANEHEAATFWQSKAKSKDCSCVTGPLERMEGAPRDGTAVLVFGVEHTRPGTPSGDSWIVEWLDDEWKYNGNEKLGLDDEDLLGFARIRPENLEVK